MSDLPCQCAVCAQLIEGDPREPRLAAVIIRAGEEIPIDEYYFHRTCLVSVLHPSVPRGEVFELD